MAWQALNDDVYNVYLIHRGCVIPLFKEVAAFKAYMKTYGVGKVQISPGLSNGMAARPPLVPMVVLTSLWSRE